MLLAELLPYFLLIHASLKAASQDTVVIVRILRSCRVLSVFCHRSGYSHFWPIRHGSGQTESKLLPWAKSNGQKRLWSECVSAREISRLTVRLRYWFRRIHQYSSVIRCLAVRAIWLKPFIIELQIHDAVVLRMTNKLDQATNQGIGIAGGRADFISALRLIPILSEYVAWKSWCLVVL